MLSAHVERRNHLLSKTFWRLFILFLRSTCADSITVASHLSTGHYNTTPTLLYGAGLDTKSTFSWSHLHQVDRPVDDVEDDEHDRKENS